MTNWSGYLVETFFHSSSRPFNCGVKPHFEAVLTARMTLPACWERGYSCPRLSLGAKSKKDVADAMAVVYVRCLGFWRGLGERFGICASVVKGLSKARLVGIWIARYLGWNLIAVRKREGELRMYKYSTDERCAKVGFGSDKVVWLICSDSA